MMCEQMELKILGHLDKIRKCEEKVRIIDK